MWTYEQRTGRLVDAAGKTLATGYAGAGAGKNNPDMQHVKNTGPLPRGRYTIGPPEEGTGHGPYVLRLTPFPSNSMWGRGRFLIHGDSVSAPGTASLGCICAPPLARHAVWESGDHVLEVVRG